MLIELELGKGTTGNEEASGICGCPVGEAVLDSVALKFVGVGGAEDFVAGDFGCNDLDYDVPVGKADYEAVFGCTIFILGLCDETFAGVVVGLAVAAAFIFGLVPAGEIEGDIRFGLALFSETYRRRG